MEEKETIRELSFERLLEILAEVFEGSEHELLELLRLAGLEQ